MNDTLATIDDLKKLFVGSLAYPENKTEDFENMLQTASDYVRIKYIETNIDDVISGNSTAKNVVANVVANIVKRSYLSSINSNIPDLEVSQISQGAGPYNMSYSPVSSGSSYYLRKDEIDLLNKIFGLKKVFAKIHKMYED